MLVDTHCHLNLSAFENDYDIVIKSANEAGVTKIIIVGDDLSSSQRAVEIAQKYDGCFAAVGIHPYHANKLNDQWKEELRKIAQQLKVVAIGECGLDLYEQEGIVLPNLQSQKEIFEEQINLASELKLPLIIHDRKAHDDIFSILHKLSAICSLSGVFHCYSAGKKNIEEVGKLGFSFGLDGNLTYDDGLQNIARLLPLEKIIFETDSPWLTPVPFREKRNEPKNVTLINDCLSKIKNVSQKETERITTENAIKLFKLS